MTLQIALLLHLLVLAGIAISQALYTRKLFNDFRRKVYMDVMDFLIDRAKADGGDSTELEEHVASWGSRRGVLRLVRDNDRH